jgi:hypothetical protein
VLLFVDDDSGYLRWVHSHPNGFVINTPRQPSASYLKLHRASCHTINGSWMPVGTSHWTEQYSKVCSLDRNELLAWSMKEFGQMPSACKICAGS